MNVHQISVFLENHAGQLAEITGILAENDVDLRAISIAETTDYGVLRIIVNDAERAKKALRLAGYVTSMTPVTVLEVPDAPGGLAPVLALLAQENLDVDYMYSLFTHREGKAYMVFRVDEEPKFLRILRDHGITPVTAEELDLR